MRYVSLFAGIGGFDLALNRLEHQCVWANEWDKYAAQIYNSNFVNTETQDSNEEHESDTSRSNGERRRTYSNAIDTRDIRTVPTGEIPDHDLLVGGFPCQAFSIAGKRRGFDDTRGTLFFEVARILKDKQPKFFILENVKGLLSHDNGNTFKTIISTLTDLGYDLQWQVLNSKNFGVPQNRERVFIVGHLRGQPRPKVFPIGANSQQDIVLPTLVSRYYGGQANGGYIGYKQTQTTEPSGQADKERGAEPNTTNVIRRETHTPSIRRLTPTECERLQGFPDGWTEGVSDTQRYKCLGNAVTVNVVYEVAKRLGDTK